MRRVWDFASRRAQQEQRELALYELSRDGQRWGANVAAEDAGKAALEVGKASCSPR